MRFRMPDFSLAMTMLWMWVGFVVVLVAGWWVLKWWEKRHPPAPVGPVLSYTQQVHQRLREPHPGKRTGHGSHRHERHGK